MKRAPSNSGSRRGFTLIEAIATIVLLSILGTFGSLVILNSTEGYIDASTVSQLHAELSISLDRIVRELRKIELDSGAAGVAPDIDSVTTTSIAWRDSDGDAYSLSLSGANLLLAVNGGASNILLSDVTGFSLDTYDESNAQLSSSLSGVACDPIRRVEISITLTRQSVSETLGTKLLIRSTMSGLSG
ncbi:MAG: type II secretion system protein [Planctomycetes bacterium]|nr:type II secretion system protein [Planctomycetota bacterium]MCH7571281.1 type II secretion system protein [Planctomycetota bacterium]MCH7601749.1 type II secretion system protein [Planctomycetota bacterium]